MNSLLTFTDRLEIRGAEGIEQAMHITDSLAERFGCHPRVRLMLVIATEEACANALEQGVTKKLPGFEMVWLVTERSFEMKVRRPQGKFIVPKPGCGDKGRKSRGLTLISEMMDKVIVKSTKDLVEITMSKELMKQEDDAKRISEL